VRDGPGSDAQEGNGSDLSALIHDPELHRLFDYWRERRRGRLMPSRRDIDPLEIAWALSRIFIVDYDPARGPVYRLAGDDIAGVFGHGNLKGLRPRDFLPPDRAKIVEGLFMRVIEDCCAVWMRGLVYLRADRLPLGERLFLPLADGATGRADGVLGMTVVHSFSAGIPGDLSQAEPRYFRAATIP